MDIGQDMYRRVTAFIADRIQLAGAAQPTGASTKTNLGKEAYASSCEAASGLGLLVKRKHVGPSEPVRRDPASRTG